MAGGEGEEEFTSQVYWCKTTEAQGDAPQHQRPAAGHEVVRIRNSRPTRGELEQQEPVVQPALAEIRGQVAG